MYGHVWACKAGCFLLSFARMLSYRIGLPSCSRRCQSITLVRHFLLALLTPSTRPQLMRQVYQSREEAAAKGRASRSRMLERYSSEVIGWQLARELQRIRSELGGTH